MLHTTAASPKPQLEACFVQTIKKQKKHISEDLNLERLRVCEMRSCTVTEWCGNLCPDWLLLRCFKEIEAGNKTILASNRKSLSIPC